MSRSLSACYITRCPCLQEFNTLQGLHDDIHVIIWLILSSSELRSAYVHMMCTHLLASSTLMDHKTSILKTTHVHASYQVTLVCIMLCQSIRMCLWRVDFMVSSSNFRYLLEPRDVAVISIDDGQWSYNWYPRIVISQQPWLSVMVRFLTVENLFLTMTNCHGQKWLGYCCVVSIDWTPLLIIPDTTYS